MDVEISIPHGSYPPAVREQVADKLAGLTRFFDRVHSLRAVLDRQKSEHRVELIASAARGAVLVVDSKAESLGKALDESIDRMGRALRRQKQKGSQLHRDGDPDMEVA
jgi:ribosomal subunit interface protein